MKRMIVMFVLAAVTFSAPAYGMQHLLTLISKLNTQEFANRHVHYKAIFETNDEQVTLNGKPFKRSVVPPEGSHERVLLVRRWRLFFDHVVELRRELLHASFKHGYTHDYFKLDRGLRFNRTSKAITCCMVIALLVYYARLTGVV